MIRWLGMAVRRLTIAAVLTVVFLSLGAEFDGRDFKTTTEWTNK